MTKVLYIEASPRKERSHSIQIANYFLEAYHLHHPADELIKIDLWELKLPELNDEMIQARYAIHHMKPFNTMQQRSWEKIKLIFDKFACADRYIFSLPMWNFGVPYKLKHYIDVITQPTLAFDFIPEKGYAGLLKGKTATVIYASGGDYKAESGPMNFDYQKPYLRLWLNFIGITNINEINISPTLGLNPEELQKLKKQAFQKCEKIAKNS